MERKQLCGYFKWQTTEISYEMTWRCLRSVNFTREYESILIAAQNNTVSKNK